MHYASIVYRLICTVASLMLYRWQYGGWGYLSNKRVKMLANKINYKTHNYSILYMQLILLTLSYCHFKYVTREISCWMLKHRTTTSIDDLLMAQRSSFPVRHLLRFIEWLSKAEPDEVTQTFLFCFSFTSNDVIISWKQCLWTQAFYLPQYSKTTVT